MEKNILKAILCFMLLSFTSCLKEDELKRSFTSYSPQNIQDGWKISTPEAEQIDGDKLKNIYLDYHERDDLWQVRSLLIFRNNKLVAESYTKNPNDITEPVAIWSCTKQVMAILAGIAWENGIIYDIYDHIGIYLPQELENYPDKKEITIENLLKMKSGIAFENDGFNGESNKLLREIPDNSLEFILALPLLGKQGETFNYNDGDPHILSAILQKQTGKSTRDWATEVLFSKLGMQNYSWINYKDGITMGAFGILATPREMAKVGHLVMNDGVWNNEQIVSPSWIRRMTTDKVPVDEVNYYNTTFGYYWWIDKTRDIMFMNGHGGQYVFIKPDKNLVVVTTAEPNTQGQYQFLLDKALKIFDQIDEITKE